MKILQLCCFSNLWKGNHEITSIDLRLGKNIFDIHPDKLEKYDLICAAPPCDQFTKASAHCWEEYPEQYIKIAKHCLDLCKKTNKYWFLENPPGRIEKFIPELKKYRTITYQAIDENKEYVIYSNFIILQNEKRYNKKPTKYFNNKTKKQREIWNPGLIETIENTLCHEIHNNN